MTLGYEPAVLDHFARQREGQDVTAQRDALLAALKEMREFAAACCRVIDACDAVEMLEFELKLAGVENGAGKRAGDAIKAAEGR